MTEKTSSIHEVVEKVQSEFKEIAGIHVFVIVHTPIVEHDFRTRIVTVFTDFRGDYGGL